MAKTRTSDDLPVLLEELSIRLGGVPVEVLAARLNGELETDWAGRPTVRASVARKVVEDHERAQREREERQAEAAARLRAWEQARREFLVRRSAELAREMTGRWARETAAGYANAEAMEADLRRTGGSPQVRAAIRERLAEELERWEAEHPRPPAPEVA